MILPLHYLDSMLKETWNHRFFKIVVEGSTTSECIINTLMIFNNNFSLNVCDLYFISIGFVTKFIIKKNYILKNILDNFSHNKYLLLCWRLVSVSI